VDNKRLVEINKAIRSHGVESIGEQLRGYMTDMKAIVS
jgi:ketol-acid reductoisomerase